MFIKKNLFFFPSRLVFRSGPETPKTEAIVEKVEKDVIKTWAYQNVDDLSRAAKKSLEEDRQKVTRDMPQTTEEDIKSLNVINEKYNEALVKIEANKDRIQSLYNYAKKRTELLQIQKSISDRYKAPFVIGKVDDYQKVLADQKELISLQKLGRETNSEAVKSDMVALQVDDMINNTRSAIDHYYFDTFNADGKKLADARNGKDSRDLQTQLNDFDAIRAKWESLMSARFEGVKDERRDEFRVPTQAFINDINKFIVAKTIGDTPEGKALAMNIDGATSNLELAQKGKDKKWEAGAQAKFDMVMAKTSALATLQLLRREAQGDKTLLVQFSEGKPEQLFVDARRLESTNFDQAKNNYKQLENIYRQASTALLARNQLTPFKEKGDATAQTRLVNGDNLFRAGKFDDAKDSYAITVAQLEREKAPATAVAAAPTGEVKKKVG